MSVLPVSHDLPFWAERRISPAPEGPFATLRLTTKRPAIEMRFGDARPLPSLMASLYHRIQGRPRAPNPTSDRRTARHHAQDQATQKRTRSPAPPRNEGHTPQASKMTHMTHHDSLSGNTNPRMTQNDSLFQVPNPEMSQNDSLFQASMPQMSQNDSHIEVFSFEMSQNDSFSGLKCPTEHPLSVADEPPATPPSPQNDTPSNARTAPMSDPASSTPAQLEQDRCSLGPLFVASSCFPRFVIPGGAKNLTYASETLRCAQDDN